MSFDDFVNAFQGSGTKAEPTSDGFASFERAFRYGSAPALAADTAQLKKQFAQPQGSLGEAATADASGIGQWLVSHDPTNPSNMGNVVKDIIPMALQMLFLKGAPNSATGRILASGAAALPGTAITQGVNAAQGQPADFSPGRFAQDAALNAAFQGGAEVASPVVSTVLGKQQAAKAAPAASTEAAENIAQAETLAQLQQANRRADIALGVEDAAKGLEAKRAAKISDITKQTEEQYQTALADQQQKTAELQAKAEQDHAKMLADLTSKKVSAQEAVDREIAKHSETALAGLTDEQVEKAVREGLGPRATMPQPVTLEALTTATSPVQKASQKAVKGVLNGVSNKFQTILDPFADTQIPQSTLGPAVQVLRADLVSTGQVVSPAMDKLLKEAATGEGAVPTVRGATAQNAQKIIENLRRAGNTAAADQLAQQFAITQPGGNTVARMMGLRTRFVDKIVNSANAADRRTAASMVEAIDQDVQKVIPPEAQTALGVLRDEWHQARSTFSNEFRSRLYRASTPDQVAEAIYTGAKTGKQMGHRAELLINQMKKESPEQVPMLSQAFTSMLTNSKNVVEEVQKMPPGLFRALYPGTGFDKPEGWIQALRGQQTVNKILADPELSARLFSAVQTGMASLGSKAKKAALAKAEEALANAPTMRAMVQESLKDAPPSPDLGAMLGKSLQKAPPSPDRGAMLDRALKREPTPQEAGKLATLGMPNPQQAGEAAGMEAMRKPFLGRFHVYMAHRMEFDVGLAIVSGGAGLLAHHPVAAAAGLAYLAGSKAISVALSNPKTARMYYNFITSTTPEQMGLWAGRLAAAGLSQSVKESE